MKKYFLSFFVTLAFALFQATPSYAATLYSNDLKSDISDFDLYFGSCGTSGSGMTCDGAAGVTDTTFATAKCVSFDANNADGTPQVIVSDSALDQRLFASFHSGDDVQVYLINPGETHWDTEVAVPSGAHNFQLCEDTNHISVYIDNDLVWEQNATFSHFDHVGWYVDDGTTLSNFLVTDTLPEATEIKIATSPSNGSKTVGSPFSVHVTVNSNDDAFNAARATVAVSSNLTINSISAPTSNSCNMQYTQTPTTSNPSFAGAIYGSSSTNCNIYTMVVTPNDTGTGTITFSNGSVKAYSDNSEIMTGVTNASFTLSDGPTPTPTPLLEFEVTSPYETYKENFTITGTKLSSITAMFLNGDDEDSVYPTSTSWEIPVTLSLGNNNFTLYGSDGTNQTATQNLIIDRHTLGDINGDGEIDLIDASLFAVDWDKTEDLTYILSDMNDDEVVDLTDLSILAKLQE